MESQIPQGDEPQAVPEDEPQDESEDESEYESEVESYREEISEDDWNRMCEKGKFKKEDMDMMIMDFLIDQELTTVAEAFHRESGCPFGVRNEDLSPIGTQKIVRDLIINGQFDDAIQTLNEKMTPVFLRFWPRLHFYLEQQKMIELCRSRDFDAALKFSRKFVMWESFKCGYDSYDYRNVCRLTLLLMLFGDDKDSPASVLLDYSRVNLFAKYVVDCMIRYQGRKTGNYVEKTWKMVEAEEYKLYQVVKFPLMDYYSGFPDSLVEMIAP